MKIFGTIDAADKGRPSALLNNTVVEEFESLAGTTTVDPANGGQTSTPQQGQGGGVQNPAATTQAAVATTTGLANALADTFGR